MLICKRLKHSKKAINFKNLFKTFRDIPQYHWEY